MDVWETPREPATENSTRERESEWKQDETIEQYVHRWARETFNGQTQKCTNIKFWVILQFVQMFNHLSWQEVTFSTKRFHYSVFLALHDGYVGTAYKLCHRLKVNHKAPVSSKLQWSAVSFKLRALWLQIEASWLRYFRTKINAQIWMVSTITYIPAVYMYVYIYIYIYIYIYMWSSHQISVYVTSLILYH